MEEPGDCNRCCHQQAEPACSFFSDDAAQTEIDTGRQTDGENRTNKLPRRQAEKDGFPVCTDFFWNFDFDDNYPLSVRSIWKSASPTMGNALFYTLILNFQLS